MVPRYGAKPLRHLVELVIEVRPAETGLALC